MVGLLSIQPLNVFHEVLPLTCYIHPVDSTFRLLSRTWITGYFEVHPLMTNRQKQKQNEKHPFFIFFKFLHLSFHKLRSFRSKVDLPDCVALGLKSICLKT